MATPFDWNQVIRDEFEPRPKIIDKVDSNTTYIGKARQFGVETSEAKWQIIKIERSETLISFYFADGDAEFDNVWDDRAVLIYSF